MGVFGDVGIGSHLGVVGLLLECKEWVCCRYQKQRGYTLRKSSNAAISHQLPRPPSAPAAETCLFTSTLFKLLLSRPCFRLCVLAHRRSAPALLQQTTGSIVFPQRPQSGRPGLPEHGGCIQLNNSCHIQPSHAPQLR